MVLSNLPPGVNASDIPGNRPIDAYSEKVYDRIGHLESENLMQYIIDDIQKDIDSWIKDRIDDGFWDNEHPEMVAKDIIWTVFSDSKKKYEEDR